MSPPQSNYLILFRPISFKSQITACSCQLYCPPRIHTYLLKHTKQSLLSTQSYPAPLPAQPTYTHTHLSPHNMRPSPRLFQQATRAPSALQRFANSPMSPPIEAYPLFVLITGMVSLACFLFYLLESRVPTLGHPVEGVPFFLVGERMGSHNIRKANNFAFPSLYSCPLACTLHIASSSTTAI